MSMDTDAETKVVQTRLHREEYDRFREVAEREGFSIKEALRAAASEFAERHGRYDPSDPFFAGADAEHASEERLTATETDEYLYGDG